jgi:hypothetical protein
VAAISGVTVIVNATVGMAAAGEVMVDVFERRVLLVLWE